MDQNDTLVRLTYAASTKQAALAILNSTAEQKPVRIFRSGALKNCLRPISKAFTKKPTQYRFDGLYYVRDVCFIPNDTPNRRVRDGFFTHPRSFRAVLLDAATKIASAAERKLYQNGVFVFLLDRSNENRHNDIDNQQYIQYCVLIESMPSEALQVCASPTRELRKRKRTSPR